MNIIDKIKKNNIQKEKKMNKIINSKKSYTIKFLNDNNEIGFFLNNKLIITGDYHFFGIYQTSTKLWIWASSIPGVKIQQLDTIKKIKEFSYLFENSSDPRISFYYLLLTQEIIMITHIKMLEWINEVLIYLSNDLFYYNPTNSNNNIQFLTLINIKEKYI